MWEFGVGRIHGKIYCEYMRIQSIYHEKWYGKQRKIDGLRSPFPSRKQAVHFALTEPLLPLNIIARSMSPIESCSSWPLGKSQREKHLKTGLSSLLAEQEAGHKQNKTTRNT